MSRVDVASPPTAAQPEPVVPSATDPAIPAAVPMNHPMATSMSEGPPLKRFWKQPGGGWRVGGTGGGSEHNVPLAIQGQVIHVPLLL